ncbi:MAG: hypothetical protein D6798_14480 [Deltaproteobacteria bacterium]|nr:MAG: hypothetical protein D6798_14480 [Deltaproteobacteria bacterium]
MISKNVLVWSLLTVAACSTNQRIHVVCPGAITVGEVSPGDATVLGPSVDELVQALDGVFRVDYAALKDGTVPPDETYDDLAQPSMPDLTLHFEPGIDPASWMRVDGQCDSFPTGYTQVDAAASIVGTSDALTFSGTVLLTFTGTSTSDALINSDHLPAETSDPEIVDAIASMPATEPLTIQLFSGQPGALYAGSADGFLATLDVGAHMDTVWNGVLLRDEGTTAPTTSTP